METSVVDVPERGRFEIRLGERVVGLASYHIENGTMTLPHTEIDPGVGGRGLGSALVAGVLEAARERGLRYVQVSTDEVYGSIEEGSFTEDSPLAPSSPYSATKAGADLLVGSYHHTYGLERTVAWYRDTSWWWEPIRSGDYRAYYERQYGRALG